MKKRACSFCAVFAALMLCLCACGDNSNRAPSSVPFSAKIVDRLFSNYADKITDDMSLDASVEVNCEIETENMTVRLPFVINGQMAVVDQKLVSRLNMAVLIQGQNLSMDVYLDGNRAYVFDGEDKFFVDAQNAAVDFSDFTDFEQNIYTEWQTLTDEEPLITTEGDLTTVTLTFSGDKMLSFFQSAVSDEQNGLSGNMTDALPEGVEFVMEDTVYTATFNKDGWMTAMSTSLNFGVNETVSEEEYAELPISTSVSVSLDMTLTVNNPGQAVTVTPPTDLDEYVSEDELYEM